MNVSNTSVTTVNNNKQELTVGLIFSYKKKTIKGFFPSPGQALACVIETV